MADFTKSFATTDGPASFSFHRIYTAKGIIYFISATGRSFRHFFHMEEREGSWKIVKAPKPPDWLLTYEKQLATVILTNQP
jgi:hypothetical protein